MLQRENLGALGMLGIDVIADQRLVMDFRKQAHDLIEHFHARNDGPGRPGGAGQVQQIRPVAAGGRLRSKAEALYVIIDTGSEVTIANITPCASFLAPKRSGVAAARWT